MNGILGEICTAVLARVEAEEERLPLSEVRRLALASRSERRSFFSAVKGQSLKVIAELKKASPSKGVIDERFDYLAIARDYELGGASAISCLTEPQYFLGSDEIFRSVRASVGLPMLRKDFILTEYQVWQSALLSADCILLIMSAVDGAQAERLFEVAGTLGMDVLFECRSESQIEAAQRMGARIIGVNNRNLSDFSVDVGTAARYRALVDPSNVFVSESGVMSVKAAAAQRAAGADAILVGEYLMRSPDRQKTLAELVCIK